ncbi:MAG: hypothetical protein AcusKO_19430 [Acuticoccus sp.]
MIPMAQDDTATPQEERRPSSGGEGASGARETAAARMSAMRAGGAGGGRGGTAADSSVDSILRIPVVLQVVLGQATMPVSNLMKLGRGQVVALDHRVGEPVDIVVNGRVIARGEVVVVDDDSSRFGVSLTEIVGPGAGTEH